MLKLFVFASCFLAVSHGDAHAQFGGQPFRPVSYGTLVVGQEMIASDWVNNRLLLLEKQFIPTPLVSSRKAFEVEDKQVEIWRNLLNNSYRNRRIISTIYKTSTTTVPVTFTCALSFVSCASISRKRLSILNDESEQFQAISSSQVVSIEPTVVSGESVRETRQADPHLYYQQPYNVADHIGVSYAPQLIDGYPPFFGSDNGLNSRQLIAGGGYGGYGLYGGGSSGSYCVGFGSGTCGYGGYGGYGGGYQGIKGYTNNEGYGVSPGVSVLSDSIGSNLDYVHFRPFNRQRVYSTSITSFSVLVTIQTETLSTACNIDASSIPLCPKMG